MAQTVTRLFISLLVGWLAITARGASAAFEWFGDNDGVLQVSGELSRRVAFVEGIQALAATHDGGAWAMSEQRLLLFAKDGSTVTDIDLIHHGYGHGVTLAVDPYDDSVWITTDRSLLLHMSGTGELMQGVPLPNVADSITVALDRSVWMVANGQVLHRGGDGSELDFAKHSVGRTAHVAIDSLRSRLWVADDEGLKRISLDGQAMETVFTSSISALRLDLRSGDVWITTDSMLIALDAHGQRRLEIPLPSDRSDRVAIQFDDETADVLVRVSDKLLRIARDGRTSTSVIVDESLLLATSAPLRAAPTIALVRPPAGGAIYEPSRELTIRIGALCNDKRCDVPDYVDALDVKVDVNDVPANGSRRDARAGIVVVTPSAPMQRGPNRVTMRAIDPYGNTAKATATITVLEPAAHSDARPQAEDRPDKRGEQVPLAFKAANKAPTVSLTSPVTGSMFTAGSTIALKASATDPDGTISKVEFYRGGTTLLGTATAAPYQLAWQSVPVGTYSVTAKAYDNRNGSATSTPASIVVIANQAPAVTVTSPGHAMFFEPGTAVPLSAAATDADGVIVRVDFFDRGTLIGTATTPPFAVTWTTASAGRHSVTARATDDKGGIGVSGSVDFVIGQPPLVVISTPVACSFIDGAPINLLLGADAMSATGKIARVEFYDNGILVGTSLNAPWSVTVIGADAGMHTITARATDDHGLTSTSRPALVTVRPANQFPTVELVAPRDGARFAAGSPVLMQANATDGDGSITAVEFRTTSSSGPLLARVTTPPFVATVSNLAPGNVAIVAVVTDDRNALASSIPARITIAANVPPSVQLTAPTMGTTSTAPANFALAATASDTDGSVSKVDFYAGTTLIGSSTTSPYTSTWNAVPAGTYSLTAKATDNSGAVVTSAPVSVTVVANASPVVSLQAPSAGGQYFAPATIQLSANASDSDGTVARVDFVVGGTVIGSSNTPPYTFIWDGVPGGSYSIMAVATDDQGATTASAPVSITVAAQAIVQADAGLDGSTVNDDSVVISGTIQAPPNSGVLVNGVLAQVDASGRFFANGVPLAPGPNSVTITVAGQDGGSTGTSINVSSSGPAPFAVIATPTDGLAPLDVTFEITNRAHSAFQRVDFDFNGDGVSDYTAYASQFVDGVFTLSATYPAGTFTSRVSIFDSNNAVIQGTTRVIVARTLQEQDNLVRSVYGGMLERLRAGKVAAALSAITGDLQDKYGAVFTALGANLSATIDSLGPIEPNWYTADRAEYVVIRDTQNGPQGFLIDFARGRDGIWRIYGM